MNTERLGYSAEEAAKVAGVGRTRIFSAIGSGRLLARKFGRRTVILREDLEAFLRALPARKSKDEDAA
jgi:excisionase family DNA binding protein